MNRSTTSTAIPTRALKFEALANISASFELFCLASGMEALGEMMDHDARAICGPRHARGHDRRAHRWGKTRGKIGFHGGKVEIERPRLRSFEGKEQALPSWEAAVAEDWLGKWAMNQMLINVSTRKFARSVRLPEGDVPAPMGSGPWILAPSATGLSKPDLHVFAKLFEDYLKRGLEAQAFSGREIGGHDDVLDFLVGHFVDVDLTRQPAS